MSSISSNQSSFYRPRFSRPSSLRKFSLISKIPILPNISLEKTSFFSSPPDPLIEQLPLPTVTAKSWAISNLKNGECLWSKSSDTRFEMASLTKMMTAYLVCSLADRLHINISTTIITITKPMVLIGGTIGELQEGDQFSILSLLYGLLLPSGNDCALALAGFYGGLLLEKFLRGAKSHLELSFEQGLRRFVKEMNIQSLKFNLKNTTFANVHGLSHKGNKSTAEELGKLAYHLLKNSILQEIVNTKKYQVTVFNVLLNSPKEFNWKNTNKLLWKDGFFGVKTGTTPNAGACLIVFYKVDGVELIITLLACNSTFHRWEEAKVLAGWGYKNYMIKAKKNPKRYLKNLPAGGSEKQLVNILNKLN